MSINARTEDDVDEKLVISKVAKASGANYGFHKEPKRPVPAAEPVVSLNSLCYIYAGELHRDRHSQNCVVSVV